MSLRQNVLSSRRQGSSAAPFFYAQLLLLVVIGSYADSIPIERGSRIFPIKEEETSDCSIQYGESTLVYSNCANLDGNFSLYWNIAQKSTESVNVSFAFSSKVESGEWIAFGKSSKEGKMVNSSAIVGHESDDGIVVKQYYLGGEESSKVIPGGNLTVSNLQGQLSNGVMTILFNILFTPLETEMQNFIWAKGPYSSESGDALKRHTNYHGGILELIPPNRTVNCFLEYNKTVVNYERCRPLGWEFYLFWNLTEGDIQSTLRVALNHSLTGYIALGFGETMVGSNAVVARQSEDGFVAKQYYLGGEKSDKVVVNNTLPIYEVDGEATAASIILRFAINISSTQQIDEIPLIFSAGPYSASQGDKLQEHEVFGEVELNLKTGSAEVEVEEEEEEEEEEGEEEGDANTDGPSKNCKIEFNGTEVTYQICRPLSSEFTLFWNLTGGQNTSSLKIALNHTLEGYIALGFGKTMVGSNAVVGRNSEDGFVAKQYYLGGTSPDQVQLNNTLPITDIWGESSESSMKMRFSIDIPSNQESEYPIIWAYGAYSSTQGDRLTKHEEYGEGEVNLLDGSAEIEEEEEEEEETHDSDQSDLSSCDLKYNGSVVRYKACRTLSGGFKLFWNLEQEGTMSKVSFALNRSPTGYISLGFGETMVGSHAIIARQSDKGFVAKEYYLGGKISSEVKPNSKLNVSDIKGEATTDSFTLQFTIFISTSQVNNLPLIWAHGQYSSSQGDSLSEHDEEGEGKVDLTLTGPLQSSLGYSLGSLYWILGLLVSFKVLLLT